ncbi:UTP--glucose-1-phosphate uridylyltransferase GalU [Thermopetrobacter sp. TC1]|uniref:UTP--glucose-1-phosphate uridylyltransferase GalU n=1 Tax=Thermopetrobacter sp. TC1 TaxID=1495045 RepID=UPI00057080F4|nr:UTP--glucose-1-phosphate uridylyltransferase GalU [Thermopetrobacter sp. TC1]
MTDRPLSRPVRKAVLPVAGLGTRLLPATKSIPKEMVTVVDRPAIQWVVDEAREAGIEHFVFVTGRGKQAIEDHFDRAYELEDTLKRRGKTALLERLLDDLLPPGQCSFVRQQEPLGLGHAVWCARDVIGDEPFALLLPDMLVQGTPGCLRQMMDIYAKTGGNLIAVDEVPREEVHKYGVVGIDEDQTVGRAMRITEMVEKPDPQEAPSTFIISGRYILQPEIFALIEKTEPGAGGEIQITDAMRALLRDQPFWAVPYEGITHDCGSPLGFLKTNLAFAMDDPELAPALREFFEGFGKSGS